MRLSCTPPRSRTPTVPGRNRARFPFTLAALSTPPEDRTLFRRVKAGCIASMLAGPVTVFDCRLPVCSRRSPFSWGRRGLNPHVPLPFPPDISRRGYAPVGRLGVEPSDTCVSGRPRRPAGSRPLSGWRRSRPPALARPSGFKPEAATWQLHHPSGERRARSPARERRSAFEAVPAPWRVHSPSRLSRPMRTGGRWQRTERTMPTAFPPPPGFRPGPATWPVHPPRKAGYSKATVSPAHPLATEPGSPVRFTFRDASGRRRANRPVRADRRGREPPPQGVPHPRFELGTSFS